MGKKLCSHYGCRSYVDMKARFCDKHQGATDKEYNKFVRNVRDARETEFYNSRAWRDLRHSFIIANPLCADCLEVGYIKQAAIADHIVELKDDWDKRLDIGNLRALCRACHNRKTKEEAQKRSKTF